MEGYKDRLASTIRKEMERRGESANSIADGTGVKERTVERWLGGETAPQGANLKSLADYWELPIERLRPDLQIESTTLERIEAKLDRLLQHAGLPADFDLVAAELEQEVVELDPPADSSGSRNGERPRASES